MSKFCSLPAKHLGPHRCDDAECVTGRCNVYAFSTYRDRRPCPGCGHVAVRTVWPPMHRKEEMVSYCTICKLETSATVHENLARKHRRKVVELKERRKEGRRAKGKK